MFMTICYNCFKEKENNSVCPHCGYSPDQDMGKYPLALPHGTILGGKYIIGRVLGQGGFGITYVAQDYQTKELVAIKEYFPDTLATRSNTHSVSSSSREREEGFCYGKECFLDEAKTMAEFIGNPNIVRVYSYFEENDTAYFVMEYIEGISLKTYLDNNGGKISFEEAKRILSPIMDALSAVHSKGIIHRDISPDNIFITKDGTVKLIDFGAARYSLGDKSRSLDVILKHGYAPKEQYTRRGRQGPYTDVYSFAATLYRAITGHVPPDAIDRIEEDSLVMPTALGSDITPEAEDALLKGLEIKVGDRFQTMQEFKSALIPVIITDNEDEEEDEEEDINNEENNTDENNIDEEDNNNGQNDETDKEEKKINLKKILPIAIPSVAVILAAVFIFSFVIKPYVLDVPVATDNVTEPSSVEDILDKSLANEDNGVNSSEVDKATESSNEKTDSAQSSSSKVTSSKSSSSKATSSKSSSSKTTSSTTSSSKTTSSQNSSSKTTSSTTSSSKATSSKSSSSKTTSSTTSSSKTASSKSSSTNTSKTTSSKSSTASSSKATSSKASSSKATSSKSSTTSSKSSTASSNSIEKDFKTTSYNGGVKITGYTGSAKNLTIPSTIGGKSVVAIGEEAFFNCYSLTSVTIPYGITKIEDSTFCGCISLTSVTIPNSVNTIEPDAFADCISLTSITIPDSVTTIKWLAFDGCSNLEKVSIPKNCEVDEDAFYGCDKVKITRR